MYDVSQDKTLLLPFPKLSLIKLVLFFFSWPFHSLASELSIFF